MTRDPWSLLRAHTAARIALGRSGASLSTDELLRFGVAHAQARDAVHAALDTDAIARDAEALGFSTSRATSRAGDRATYLRRPDLGRRLHDDSRVQLQSVDAQTGRLIIVAADGLSSLAVQAHTRPLLTQLRPLLDAEGFAFGPLIVADQARVALGDEIGELLCAQAVLVLIGERPGLSSPDSLGAYLTWKPKVGCHDAQRNCVSNIRPQGLPYADAAGRIAWLLAAARRLGGTGVALKDESVAALGLR